MAAGNGHCRAVARYTRENATLNKGRNDGFGSSHQGIVGFLMADGSTTFLSEAINFNGTGLKPTRATGPTMGSLTTMVEILDVAKDPARGVLQKLSCRNDGNAVAIPE